MIKSSSAIFASIFLSGTLFLLGCNQNPKSQDTSAAGNQPATGGAAQSSGTSQAPDSLTDELKKLAGSSARDCGRIAISGDVKPASECAMQANSANKPFYVRYDLPVPDAQMAIATLRTEDGKLLTAQLDSKGWEKAPEGGTLSGDKKVSVTPCPTPNMLRVANSGRVTCFPPTQMPAGMSPHGGGGMQMPPATGTNPHGGMGMPPAGTPNPHKTAPSPNKSH